MLWRKRKVDEDEDEEDDDSPFQSAYAPPAEVAMQIQEEISAAKRRKLLKEVNMDTMLSMELRVRLHGLINTSSVDVLRDVRTCVELNFMEHSIREGLKTLAQSSAASLGWTVPMAAAQLIQVEMKLDNDAASTIQFDTVPALQAPSLSHFSARWVQRLESSPVLSIISNEAKELLNEVYENGDMMWFKQQFHTLIPTLKRDRLEAYYRRFTEMVDFPEEKSIGSPFRDLPDHLWFHVMSLMSFTDIVSCCSGLSRHFFRLTMSPPIWSKLVSFRFGSRLLMNEHIPALISKLPKLRVVKFGKYIKNDKMQELAAHLENRRTILEGLNFSTGPTSVGDPLFEIMFRTNRPWRLRDINLSSCKVISDITLRLIGSSCPELRSLNLKLCFRISDTGLFYLSTGCPQLEVLTLRYCVNVTDVGLRNLANGCKRLNTVSFRNCVQMSNEGIKFLAASCPLLRVSFSKCFRLTDESLHALGKHCPSLQYAHFSFCNNLTDVGVTYLASRCRDLRNIDLSVCQGITDESIRSLANHCPHLEHVCLKQCTLVSPQATNYLKDRCSKLIKLCLMNYDPDPDDQDEPEDNMNVDVLENEDPIAQA